MRTLLYDPRLVVEAARLLLNLHFTPVLSPLIASMCGLDLDEQVPRYGGEIEVAKTRRPRCTGFTEEVLRAYSYECAFCCYGGAVHADNVAWHEREEFKR